MKTVDVDGPQDEMSTLKYHGQTPICSSTNKRPFIELSPCVEDNGGGQLDISKQVEDAITKSVNLLMPKMIENIKEQIKSVVETAIGTALSNLKNEMMLWTKEEISKLEKREALRTLSEAELLESYNRKDNVKIIGLSETLSNDGKREQVETTINKVISVGDAIDAKITHTDIFIAHRLPTRSGRDKPVIVRFSRRIKKIDLLRKKRTLSQINGFGDVKIFEDLSTTRVNFLRIMKTDERIQSTWTREGTIYFIWKEDQRIYKINGLWEGGDFLDYSIDNVLKCFNCVFGNSNGQSDP